MAFKMGLPPAGIYVALPGATPESPRKKLSRRIRDGAKRFFSDIGENLMATHGRETALQPELLYHYPGLVSKI